MERVDLAEDFETLELSSDATLLEVRNAYLLLREIYSKESIVTLPLGDELCERSKRGILDQIEQAYVRLVSFFESENVSEGHAGSPGRASAVLSLKEGEVENFTGPNLRRARESLGIDLQDAAFATKITVQQLRNIEEENYPGLPPEVYTRGFVAAYAKFLSLDPKRVSGDYMGRYALWGRSRE
jgi:hypothetical protein